MINPRHLILLANLRYREIKRAKGLVPQDMPSDQITALAETLAELINQELVKLNERMDRFVD